MDELDLSLRALVRRRILNFEQLVEVLSTRGYVTDADGLHGLGFTRTSIDRARQEDFDALFRVLLPGRLNTIRLATLGSPRGSFTTVLYNSEVIEYATMKEILADIERELQERDG